ncbi:F-box protein GID2 [Acorus calamus]|uniref:F-box protein GID2 n=1 Tax=Acorus calamus TaxID=4465 RepID=A0AAV9FDF3_ACOCL|nr:F-box protein GID2 [Acorus calamus]
MKRCIESLSVDGEKRRRIDADEEEEVENQVDRLGEDLLFEVLKHADAQSLALASCVSKLWHRTAQDERLWEIVCGTPTPNSNKKQLRSVVLALGGFRRLHSLYLWPLNKPPPSVEAVPPPPPQPQPSLLFPDFSAPAASSSKTTQRATPKRWGKDEVNLSLSLLSIRYFEKMSLPNRSL